MARKKTRRSFGSIRERNGKFEASYKRNGKTYYGPRQFVDRTTAQRWLNGEEQLVLEGRWTPTGVTSPINTTWTLGSYAEHHIEVQTTSKGTPLRPSVKELYRGFLRRGLASLANLPLEEISSEIVSKWYSALAANRKLSTASKHYKFLHSVMARAIVEDYYKQPNPCQVRGAQNASSKINLFTPSMNEVGMIARAINRRFKRLVLIMANAGLRFGELAALTRSDVQFVEVGGVTRAVIKVQRAMTRLANNVIVIGEPKSSEGVRDVVLNSALTDVIQEQLDSLTNLSTQALVFPSAHGTYLRNDVLNKALKSAAKRAGISPTGVSPHAFRRAGATELANTGANIAEVKEFLGDSSEQAALRYVKTTGRTVALIEAMNTGHADAV